MTFNPFTLSGKTILITGASSGIGRQCAIDCSRMGARVVLMGRNEARLAETQRQMEGDGHLVINMDLTHFDGIEGCIASIVTEVGPFDGLIHAAGIERTLPVKFTKPMDYEDIYRTNSISAFEIVRHLISKKNSNIGASLVLISSITSLIGRAGVVAYAASKGGLLAAIRPMAIELAPRKMRINCISPGTILTPMMEQYLSSLTDEQRERRLDGFLLGLGRTEDVSNACIYLLRDASRWVTGQNLIVDGGYTVR